MRIRALLFSSAVAVTAVMGLGASGASAATLYTSAARNTLVPVGTTVSATATAPGIRLTSGTATVNNCAASSLHLLVTSNGSSNEVVSGTVDGGSFSTCNLATTFTGSWTLEVGGDGVMAGAFEVFNAVSVTNVTADFANADIHGNITTGASVTQGTTSGTGLCIDLANAGTLTHPLTSAGKIDGQYCFTGTGANWSLGPVT